MTSLGSCLTRNLYWFPDFFLIYKRKVNTKSRKSCYWHWRIFPTRPDKLIWKLQTGWKACQKCSISFKQVIFLLQTYAISSMNISMTCKWAWNVWLTKPIQIPKPSNSPIRRPLRHIGHHTKKCTTKFNSVLASKYVHE